MDLCHHGGAVQNGIVSRAVEFTELLATSDFVSLHVRLTERTRNIIGPQELALMLPSSVIVNTARGRLIDEEALAAAWRAGWIGAAGPDVTCEEPLPPTSPLQGCPVS
jgi:phosphoglycerate dehydrogenase-like enzyme